MFNRCDVMILKIKLFTLSTFKRSTLRLMAQPDIQTPPRHVEGQYVSFRRLPLQPWRQHPMNPYMLPPEAPVYDDIIGNVDEGFVEM